MKTLRYIFIFVIGFILGSFIRLSYFNSSKLSYVHTKENINLYNYIIISNPTSEQIKMINQCASDGFGDEAFVRSYGIIDPREVRLYEKKGSDDYVVSFKFFGSLDLYVAYFIKHGISNPIYKGVYSLA